MGFAGVDIPTAGNQIVFVDPVAGTQNLGRLQDQILLYADVSVGRWLHRDPCSKTVTGFAVQAELHYASTLDNSDSVSGVLSGVGWNTGFDFRNNRNRVDSVFGAIVLHTELRNQLDIRVAGLLPLSSSDSNFFDSEILVALVQRF